MRKAVAIFLLAVTLYNSGGYMAVFQYFIYQSDKFDELQISKDRYKTSDLVEIKIPVHLTGIDNWRGYETVSGTVQLAQNAYNYVRMKMTTDTIYVMCVPNYKTTKLIKENIICAREISEAPFNTKRQTIPVKPVKVTEQISSSVTTIEVPHFEIMPVKFLATQHKPTGGILRITAEPPESFLS